MIHSFTFNCVILVLVFATFCDATFDSKGAKQRLQKNLNSRNAHSNNGRTDLLDNGLGPKVKFVDEFKAKDRSDLCKINDGCISDSWEPSIWWPSDFTADQTIVQHKEYIEINNVHYRTSPDPFANYVLSPSYSLASGDFIINENSNSFEFEVVLAYSGSTPQAELNFFNTSQSDYRLGMGYIVMSSYGPFIPATELGLIAGVGITNDAIYGVILTQETEITGANVGYFTINKLVDYTPNTITKAKVQYSYSDSSVSYFINDALISKVPYKYKQPSMPSYSKLLSAGYPPESPGVGYQWTIQFMPMIKALEYSKIGEPYGKGLVDSGWSIAGYITEHPQEYKYPFGTDIHFNATSSMKLHRVQVSST